MSKTMVGYCTDYASKNYAKFSTDNDRLCKSNLGTNLRYRIFLTISKLFRSLDHIASDVRASINVMLPQLSSSYQYDIAIEFNKSKYHLSFFSPEQWNGKGISMFTPPEGEGDDEKDFLRPQLGQGQGSTDGPAHDTRGVEDEGEMGEATDEEVEEKDGKESRKENNPSPKTQSRNDRQGRRRYDAGTSGNIDKTIRMNKLMQSPYITPNGLSVSPDVLLDDKDLVERGPMAIAKKLNARILSSYQGAMTKRMNKLSNDSSNFIQGSNNKLISQDQLLITEEGMKGLNKVDLQKKSMKQNFQQIESKPGTGLIEELHSNQSHGGFVATLEGRRKEILNNFYKSNKENIRSMNSLNSDIMETASDNNQHLLKAACDTFSPIVDAALKIGKANGIPPKEIATSLVNMADVYLNTAIDDNKHNERQKICANALKSSVMSEMGFKKLAYDYPPDDRGKSLHALDGRIKALKNNDSLMIKAQKNINNAMIGDLTTYDMKESFKEYVGNNPNQKLDTMIPDKESREAFNNAMQGDNLEKAASIFADNLLPNIDSGKKIWGDRSPTKWLEDNKAIGKIMTDLNRFSRIKIAKPAAIDQNPQQGRASPNLSRQQAGDDYGARGSNVVPGRTMQNNPARPQTNYRPNQQSQQGRFQDSRNDRNNYGRETNASQNWIVEELADGGYKIKPGQEMKFPKELSTDETMHRVSDNALETLLTLQLKNPDQSFETNISYRGENLKYDFPNSDQITKTLDLLEEYRTNASNGIMTLKDGTTIGLDALNKVESKITQQLDRSTEGPNREPTINIAPVEQQKSRNLGASMPAPSVASSPPLSEPFKEILSSLEELKESSAINPSLIEEITNLREKNTKMESQIQELRQDMQALKETHPLKQAKAENDHTPDDTKPSASPITTTPPNQTTTPATVAPTKDLIYFGEDSLQQSSTTTERPTTISPKKLFSSDHDKTPALKPTPIQPSGARAENNTQQEWTPQANTASTASMGQLTSAEMENPFTAAPFDPNQSTKKSTSTSPTVEPIAAVPGALEPSKINSATTTPTNQTTPPTTVVPEGSLIDSRTAPTTDSDSKDHNRSNTSSTNNPNEQQKLTRGDRKKRSSSVQNMNAINDASYKLLDNIPNGTTVSPSPIRGAAITRPRGKGGR